MNRKKLIIPGIIILSAPVFLWAFFLRNDDSEPDINSNDPPTKVNAVEEIAEYKFGIPVNDFDLIEKEVKSGQSLSSILNPYNVPINDIHQLVQHSEGVFDVTSLQVGKPYTLFCTKTEDHTAKCMVYQPHPSYYVVFDLRDTASVYRVDKKVRTREVSSGGVITSSLYQAVYDQGLSISVAAQLYDIYKWSVDFFALQKGDEFKVVLDEELVDTTVINAGNIKAAYFKTGSKELYAFRYEWDGNVGYYDEEGMSLKSRFLQAPLEFTRISSKYSMKRYHPILKKSTPHLGIDYAAPKGTPIVAVADGVVLKASYTSGNGNYVKLKHDNTYSTQYLHMSKFGKGIKKGVKVKQGDIIGYVGSTGLSTGPHLCYRFWKNGKQVDPFKEQPQAMEPLPEGYRKDFLQKATPLKKQLEAIIPGSSQ